MFSLKKGIKEFARHYIYHETMDIIMDCGKCGTAVPLARSVGPSKTNEKTKKFSQVSSFC